MTKREQDREAMRKELEEIQLQLTYLDAERAAYVQIIEGYTAYLALPEAKADAGLTP